MVQIVKLAEPKEVKCYNCKTVLSYVYSDMSFDLESDYTGCRERVARINCPVCGCKPQVPLNF